MADPVTLSAACHCKSNSFSITLPASAFPLRSSMCQCNTCRHVTGMTTLTDVWIPDTLSVPPPDLSTLNVTRYDTSPNFPRYFCTTCGAHIMTNEPDGWGISTGILDKTGDLLERVQIWIDDTGDGGLSFFVTENNGKEVKSWLRSSDDSNLPERYKGPVEKQHIAEYKKRAKETALKTMQEGDKLRAKCHCGGVEFYLTRPDENDPAPDPKRPQNNGGRWWVNEGGLKYVADACPCWSCRVCSGYELNTWVYVPTVNIFWKDGKQIEYNEGTLKSYWSTEGAVVRDFCGTCGAKVFYRAPERRKATGVVDVAAGLFEGDSRCEGWLKWIPDPSYQDDAMDLGLCGSLNEGMKKWNEELESSLSS